MLRLLAFLCAGMFAILLIGGEDHGQLRPGLVAQDSLAQAPAPRITSPAQPAAVIEAAYTPGAAAQPAAAHLPVVLPLIKPVAELPEPEATEPEAEIRYVSARAVNVREGPSTEFPVVERLTRGEAIRVMWVEDNGWVHIVIEGDGISGFVSGDLLSATAP